MATYDLMLLINWLEAQDREKMANKAGPTGGILRDL
jgi:hypothetical protein